MTSAIPVLPERQLRPLTLGYAAALRRRRVATALGVAIVVVCVLVASEVAQVDLRTMFDKIGGLASYGDRILRLDGGARVWSDPAEWFWGLKRWLSLLGDTLLISYMGTCLGTGGAFLLAFSASNNIGRHRVLRFCVRRFFEFCRTVPDLVFALVFVVAFGLGAMPGVLALAIHTTGALGKLFTEIVENIDMRPVEGLRASGAGFASTIRYAVVPQVLSNFVSYALLRFEINVRGAAVMGFVGAGGIGEDLIEAVRKFYYSDVSAILALLISTVFVIDIGAGRLRHRFLRQEARA